MRKLLLLWLLVPACLVPGALSAQEGLSAAIRLSPNIGFGRQFVNDKRTDSLAVSPRVGIAFGVDLHHGINDNVGVFFGAGISMRGLGDFRDYSQSYKPQRLNMVYLELPIGLDFSTFDLGGGYYVKVKTGVSVDILTGATYKGPETVRYASRLQPVNLSGLAAAGVEKDLMGAGYIYLGLSYHHGFFNLLKTNYEATYTTSGPSGSTSVKFKPFEHTQLRYSYAALDLAFIFR